MAKAILKTAGDRAFLHFQGKIIPALIGQRGLSLDKREGDLRTPVGELPFRRVFYRADRLSHPVCAAGLPSSLSPLMMAGATTPLILITIAP